MQLTGIKTIGKMTDYMRIEVCVRAGVCAGVRVCKHPCTRVFFFPPLPSNLPPKMYILNIFPTHVLEY